jgi:hypothetical protein
VELLFPVEMVAPEELIARYVGNICILLADAGQVLHSIALTITKGPWVLHSRF